MRLIKRFAASSRDWIRDGDASRGSRRTELFRAVANYSAFDASGATTLRAWPSVFNTNFF